MNGFPMSEVQLKKIFSWFKKREPKVLGEFIWICPGCSYQITDIQMGHFVADFGCPRCKSYRFGEFILRNVACSPSVKR